jgi:xanthine dehydrogenase accessory factor
VKRDLLAALVAARQNNEPVVLVRGLNSNSQFIVTRKKACGDIDTSVPILRDAARSALDKDDAHTLETEEDTYLIQTLAAAPRIIIIGAVHIAQALIPMAETAGYDIILIDPRTAFANPQRFPGIEIDNRWPHEAFEETKLDIRTAVVTLSHDPKIDEPALRAAMDSDAFYIGALGSKANHEKRLGRLKELGYTERQLKRINGPIGLPLGGRSPAEIAVATLAQIVQARHRGSIKHDDSD